MESIQPELPWHSPYQYGDLLPEATLVQAVIMKAFEDSKSRYGLIKKTAREWFYTRDFERYCELLRFDPSILRQYIVKQWDVTA